VDLTAAFALPTEQEHGGNHHWKYAALGPDGRIYTNVGVNCNVCDTDRDKFALLVSFRPDGSDRRIEARGVRNSVGMAHHPVTRELWATNHGRDWVGNDTPEDSLLRVRRVGEDFGFPYCLGTWADPQYNRGRACGEFSQPAALLGPHTAVLGMRFYTGTMFPEQYRNQIFIARRGSWNRTRLSGFDVVVAHLDAQGNVTRIEEFLTGEEASFLVITDGKNIIPLASAQDHKAIFDNDQGPNTGGMGAYSPAPVVTPDIHNTAMREVIQRTIDGMAAEGRPYRGVLYAGLMIKNGQVKTLEKKGLVARQVSAEDRRVSLLGLTSAGSAVLAKIDRYMADRLDQIFSHMSVFEQETVTRSLELLNDAVTRAGVADSGQKGVVACCK